MKRRTEVKEISMASKDKVLTIWLDHNSSPRLLTTIPTILAFNSSFFIPMELLTSTKNFNTKPLQAENKKDSGKNHRQLVLLHNPLNPYYNVNHFAFFAVPQIYPFLLPITEIYCYHFIYQLPFSFYIRADVRSGINPR